VLQKPDLHIPYKFCRMCLIAASVLPVTSIWSTFRGQPICG